MSFWQSSMKNSTPSRGIAVFFNCGPVSATRRQFGRLKHNFGRLPKAPRIPPDSSQTAPATLPDHSQTPPKSQKMTKTYQFWKLLSLRRLALIDTATRERPRSKQTCATFVERCSPPERLSDIAPDPRPKTPRPRHPRPRHPRPQNPRPPDP